MSWFCIHFCNFSHHLLCGISISVSIIFVSLCWVSMEIIVFWDHAEEKDPFLSWHQIPFYRCSCIVLHQVLLQLFAHIESSGCTCFTLFRSWYSCIVWVHGYVWTWAWLQLSNLWLIKLQCLWFWCSSLWWL